MKRQVFIVACIVVALLISGCANIMPGGSKPDEQINNQESKVIEEVKKTKQPQEDEKTFYARIGKEMVEKKEDPFKVLEVYKKLINLFPAQSDERQKVIRYLLDENLRMVKEGKGETALKLALELDKLIPNDFYIQNRIIGAYSELAKDEIKRGELDRALELTNTGLQIRFDKNIMEVKLDILILLAKRAIKLSDKDGARIYLNDVASIIEAQDDKSLFQKQLTAVKKLLISLN